MSDPKFHLFADESGQNSRGVRFLVCAVAVPKDEVDEIRRRLEQLESDSSRSAKWVKSSVPSKHAYLRGVRAAIGQGGRAYWRSCGPGSIYAEWTCEVITQAAAQLGPAQLWITVDGLQETELRRLRKTLRARRISCKKLRGTRDESEALVRLADALVGFLSDREKQKPYAERCWPMISDLFTEL